jgi:gamma-glutamyl-gamma-aminobutyrate hydrolase PuuD
MTAPLIGITTEMTAAAWHDRVREAVLSPAVYCRAIDRAGAVPVLLPPAATGAVTRLATWLDGLVFSGGCDVDARCYAPAGGEGADWPDQARDVYELALMRAAIEAGTPFLAIGRGLQVLNVACGGTVSALSLDAPPAGPDASGLGLPVGEVRISPDSKLGEILGATVTVSWTEHDAVAQLGSGLAVTGRAAGEIVAAAEVIGHPFGIGVRWHPQDASDMRIFNALRSAAEAGAGRAAVTAAAALLTTPSADRVASGQDTQLRGSASDRSAQMGAL